MANKFSLNQKGDFVVLVTPDNIPVSMKSEGLPEEKVREIEADLRADFMIDEVPPCGNVSAYATCKYLSM